MSLSLSLSLAPQSHTNGYVSRRAYISSNLLHADEYGCGRAKKRKRSKKRRANEKEKWTREEDDRLLLGVKTYGAKQWPKIAEIVVGRNSKQCRDRWANLSTPRSIRTIVRLR